MPELREPLSKERIVDAAVRLVDQEGLAALTMRRLGRELGVEGMSLYTHFPNKAALLFALVTRLIDEIRPVHAPGAGWQERLRAVMRSFRQAGLAHPSVFALLATRPWDGIALARLDEDLRTLRAAGFDAEGAGYVLWSMISFVTGFVLKEIREQVRETYGYGIAHPDARPAGGRLAPYPALAASRHHLGGPGPHAEPAFEAGLDLLFLGAAAILSGQAHFSAVMPAELLTPAT